MKACDVKKAQAAAPQRVSPPATSSYTLCIPTGDDAEYAAIVSAWTQASGSMLPRTLEEILALFRLGVSVLVVDEQGTAVSHTAATAQYPDGSIEIGAIHTAAEHRGRGAASRALLEVIKRLRERNPGCRLFVLGNEESAGLYLRLGGKEIQDIELRSDVWKACLLRPRNLAQRAVDGCQVPCCDTPYDLSEVITRPAQPAVSFAE